MKRITLETDDGQIISLEQKVVRWTVDGSEFILTLESFYDIIARRNNDKTTKQT